MVALGKMFVALHTVIQWQALR